MAKKPLALLLPVALAAAFALPVLAADVLTAVKVAAPPKLAAGAGDPAWAKAKPLTVPLSGGMNFKDGATTATLKAVYSGDTFYLLLQYADPTQSVRRSPYVKQADGSWKKLTDPDDKGGDNNKYYEDKFALIWNVGNSIKGFGEQGCMVACHAGEAGKPFGNKYTAAEGEMGDIWHLKTIRTGYIGQVDDQYLDSTRFDKDKAPEAGRKADPKTGGGYADIKLVGGKPEFMNKNAVPANKKGGTYYLKEADKAPFDDSKFKPGDEVASIMVAPFSGDRGDIAAAISWKAGKWTAAMSRKLVTGSKYDVQFDKLDATYDFGLAAFDNAQVRHAFQTGALKLKFAK
jgi:ethylbenzene dehydrogenase